MARRALLVQNPIAGQRRAPFFAALLEALAREGIEVTLERTGARGDAERLARDGALSGGFDVVIAAGGDGTVNEVVNGLAGHGVPLAIAPLGTANVTAREIGLPPRPEAIARVVADGATKRVHLGIVDGRLFSAMTGAGFDALVAHGVSLALKKVAGRAAYVIECFRRVVPYDVPPLDVHVDGVPVNVAGLIASKGRLYGGAFVCAPAGDLARDSFEVVLFERRGRAALVRSSWGLVRGRLDHCPGVRIVRARRVEIRGPAGQPLQVDGDVIARTPAVVEIAPVTLDLVVPSRPRRRGR